MSTPADAKFNNENFKELDNLIEYTYNNHCYYDYLQGKKIQ